MFANVKEDHTALKEACLCIQAYRKFKALAFVGKSMQNLIISKGECTFRKTVTSARPSGLDGNDL